MTDLVKQLFENRMPVFAENTVHIFGDASTRNYLSVLNRPVKDRGFDDRALTKYNEFKARIEAEGYDVAEVDAHETDGRKGKQSGRRLMVYKGLDPTEKLVVLGHEYQESRLMRETGRPDYALHPSVQRLEEEMFGPDGEFDFAPAYNATIEAGERTGMKRTDARQNVVFGD